MVGATCSGSDAKERVENKTVSMLARCPQRAEAIRIRNFYRDYYAAEFAGVSVEEFRKLINRRRWWRRFMFWKG